MSCAVEAKAALAIADNVAAVIVTKVSCGAAADMCQTFGTIVVIGVARTTKLPRHDVAVAIVAKAALAPMPRGSD